MIATPPPFVFPPACQAGNRLAQTGRHTLAVETGAACTIHVDHETGSRWFAAIVVGGDARIHFRATIVDPPNAPLLSLDVDGADRDGDGLDDVALRVSLEGLATVRARAAGRRVGEVVRSLGGNRRRDPDEPDASLRALASTAALRAPRSKDAPSVPRFVEQVRALYRALCLEGGSPRIVDLLNAPALTCGTSRGLEEAGLAEVRAYAVAGDPVRAIAALDRAQLAPATHTTSRTADAQAWITQMAPVVSPPSVLRAAGAGSRKIERGRGPSWGALAFDAGGKLLIRTTAGVVRLDPAQGDEAVAEGFGAWRAGVVSPDGAYRWIEAYDACDGVALHATFAPTANADPRDLPLPIAPPLGSKCERAGARGEPALASAVAWGPRGLEAIVAGEPLLFSPDLVRATPSVASLEAIRN